MRSTMTARVLVGALGVGILAATPRPAVSAASAVRATPVVPADGAVLRAEWHGTYAGHATVNRNVNVNRNVDVNVHRSGPGWGGVAAGAAVGVGVGAAAATAAHSTYYPPPYPYGYPPP